VGDRVHQVGLLGFITQLDHWRRAGRGKPTVQDFEEALLDGGRLQDAAV
jgi:hypothetical protein